MATASLPFWQLLTLVAVPTLMVFVGILFNRQDYRDLRNELGGKIDKLAAQQHSDMMMIQSVLRDPEGRLSKLEAK